MVYLQRIGSAEARAIAGTEGASYPFWSPDGAYVAFFANGKLRKTAIAGGAPQNIAAAGSGRGGSWNRKGVILFTREATGPLWRVNADGSGLAPVTEIAKNAGQSHRWPFFLPDGDHFLMFSADFSGKEGSARIYLKSLSGRAGSDVSGALSGAAYAAGRIYYVDVNGALVTATLDTGAGKIGAPQMVAGKVARSPSTFYATFAVSGNSTLVYSAANLANYSQLTWIDETGKEIGRAGPVGVLANPSLSPDGRRVAFDSDDFKANNVDVWLFDLLRGTGSRFTFDPAEDASPAWSRDGAAVAYRTVLEGRATVLVRKASGLEPGKPLAVAGNGQGDTMPNSWGPGNREILCTLTSTATGNRGLVLLPTDGSPARPFLSTGAMTGQISPDGKWVAYSSNETGDWEIYVTTFPAAAGKWQVSRGGGAEPRWRGDGKAIYYVGPRQMLTEAAVDTDEAFSADAPRELFPIRARAPISSTDLFTYDVAPDGKRFLVNQYVRPEQAPPLSIVLHAERPAAK
jgi:Tol biopolymer transport system component